MKRTTTVHFVSVVERPLAEILLSSSFFRIPFLIRAPRKTGQSSPLMRQDFQSLKERSICRRGEKSLKPSWRNRADQGQATAEVCSQCNQLHNRLLPGRQWRQRCSWRSAQVPPWTLARARCNSAVPSSVWASPPHGTQMRRHGRLTLPMPPHTGWGRSQLLWEAFSLSNNATTP